MLPLPTTKRHGQYSFTTWHDASVSSCGCRTENLRESIRHEHGFLVPAWIRLELSTSSDPMHDQYDRWLMRPGCYGNLIVHGPSDLSHTTERVERDAFIPPRGIGGKTQLSLFANADYLIYTTYIKSVECITVWQSHDANSLAYRTYRSRSRTSNDANDAVLTYVQATQCRSCNDDAVCT
jgi:hypothetical protein